MVFLVVTLCSIAVVSTIREEYVASIFRVNVIMMRMLYTWVFWKGGYSNDQSWSGSTPNFYDYNKRTHIENSGLILGK
jgi:hypothetical protein